MIQRLLFVFLLISLSGCKGGSSSDEGDAVKANRAPVANAGADQRVTALHSVTLIGTGTDADGTVTAYAWAQTGGITVELDATDTAQISFTAPDVASQTTLTFTLSVTDDDGDTHSDSVVVIVIPTPAVPSSGSLSPNTATLDRWQDTLQLDIDAVLDQRGEPLTEYRVFWSSDNVEAASVSESGMVISNHEGIATISATIVNDNGTTTLSSVIQVAVQQNSQCLPGRAPNRVAALAPITYTEVRSNTVATLDGGWHRSFALDLNLDGLDDMLWLETSWISDTKEMPNTSSLWLSNGDGHFTNATTEYIPDELPVDLPRQLFEADLDGNGKMDYVVLQHGYDPGGLDGLSCDDDNGTVCPGAPNMVISVDAEGKLRDRAPLALSPYDTNGFTHAGGLADVDCDGDVDILEGQLSNEVAMAESHLQVNDGQGQFVTKTDALPIEVQGIGFYGSAFCDLDADGDPDIYIAQLGILPGLEAADVVLTNNGSGQFRLLTGRRAPPSRVGEHIQQPADLHCLDYDGDGLNDILKPNEADETYPAFELLRNNGDMTFTDVSETHFVQTPLLAGSYRPFIKDLNADGWPDVLAQGTGDYLRIFWNTGKGFSEFRFSQDTAINTQGASTTLGDFNGDGKIDIHIGRASYESFVLLAN